MAMFLIMLLICGPILVGCIILFIPALKKKDRIQIVICCLIGTFMVFRIIMAGIEDYNMDKEDKALQQQMENRNAK